ncbi:hypothetical protein DK853_46330, partial [Klebsiella oxytoca]
VIGQIGIAMSISVERREIIPQMQDTVMFSKSDQLPHICIILLIPGELSPVNPSGLIVLTVTVVVAVLAVSKLVP